MDPDLGTYGTDQMSISEQGRILRIATTVNAARDLDGIVTSVIDPIAELFPNDRTVLGLLDRAAGEVDLFEIRPLNAETCTEGRLTAIRRMSATEDNIAGWVIANDAACVRAHEDEPQCFAATLIEGEQSASQLFVPLHGRDDIVGVLGLFASRRGAFSESDAVSLSEWAHLSGVAIENLHNFHEAQELSLRDPLTGAFNRRYFEQTLAKEYNRYERHGEGFALVLADMDDLKGINDRFGHTVGDQALVQTIEILDHHTRGSDAICRISGDEFAILLPHTDRKQACAAASHLARAVRERNIYEVNSSTSLPITLSMGYAVAPDDADHPAALIGCADSALYQAKDAGHARVVAYSGRPQRRSNMAQG
jgi:diguanylate cyclase (GGDEF)-like protein